MVAVGTMEEVAEIRAVDSVVPSIGEWSGDMGDDDEIDDIQSMDYDVDGNKNCTAVSKSTPYKSEFLRWIRFNLELVHIYSSLPY